MKRDYVETRKARRYVARCVAMLIDNGSNNEFIFQDETDPAKAVDEFTVRRRKVALARLVAKLRRDAAEEK